MPKVVLVNDTSLYAPYFGCQLTGQTLREQFARTGLTLIAAFPGVLDMSIAEPYLDAADLVIINAEGSLHHGQHPELLHLARNWPCALINGVYQDNGYQPELTRFQYISMRESLSAKEVRKQEVVCRVVPDLLFASKLLRAIPEFKRDIELGITDNEFNNMAGSSPTDDLAYQSLQRIARCEKICAGRFHTAVAAAVMRVPFSTWDSNTWKTRGLMLDMNLSHLYFDSQTEAIRNAPVIFDDNIDQYVRSAQNRIEDMFDVLAKIAMRNAIADTGLRVVSDETNLRAA